MLLIKQAELDAYKGNVRIADVRCRDGFIIEIGNNLFPKETETVLHANGSALIPGLHDHHLHLMAMAAANASIYCGSPEINTATELRKALESSDSNHWIRGIQYHESIAGSLDRWQLDKWVSDRPVRIQHRSGILWILNSCAIEQLQLEKEQQSGLERNAQGQVTGRLFRLDQWLREKIGDLEAPDFASISIKLARWGITGITDTSAGNNASTLIIFENALAQQKLKQRVIMMGNEQLPVSSHPMITRGAMKILLDEFQLPDWETLQKTIKTAHQQQRPVAFHCVTETQLVFALAALQESGPLSGDRIEHASLCPDEIMPLFKKTGAAVVTQPGLLQSRGDQYQDEVPTLQHSSLYRCKNFLDQGISLAFSSDAPYGPANPWHNMQAAIDRCNTRGYIFNEKEKLTPEAALQAYLRDPIHLYKTRHLMEGEAADFCLLSSNWSSVRKSLGKAQVNACIIAGQVITV